MQALLFLTALTAASAVDCRERTIPDFLCLLTAAAGLISFSPDPYFIDLDTLVSDRLLKRAEINAVDWGADPRHVDYGKIYEHRFALIPLCCSVGFCLKQ